MVANPMQKKARNSFLLGVVITLAISLIIFLLIYFLVINKPEEKKKELGEKVMAYALNQSVKSGQVVTSDMFTQIEIYESMVPGNYINLTQFLNMELQDEYGNLLYTNADGELYMIKDNFKYVPTSDETDNENNVVVKTDEQGSYKTTKDGEKQYITTNTAISTNSKGEFYVLERNNLVYRTTEEEGKAERVIIEQDEDGFYRTKIGEGKEHIKLLNVPFVAKIDLSANTVITSDMFSKGEKSSDDLRYVEYNMLILPTTIVEGDFIDIRLTLPSGQDLIVVSKKEVKTMIGDTIGLELTEGEILMMESAIVESYIMTASKLYALQYVEPGNQQAAIKTYTPTAAVRKLITENANIVGRAKTVLVERFNGEIRNSIEYDRNAYEMDAQDNLEEKLQQEIENARAAREAYLSGLTSY